MDLRSGTAFWPIKNGLLRSYPPLDRDEAADVAIVGAGITGALIAHALSTAGANVVVIDRRDVASGSTAATTGLLLYETDTPLIELAQAVGTANAVRAWHLGCEVIGSIERLCAHIGDECGFARREALYLASSRRDAKSLAAEHAMRAAHGFAVDWLSRSDLQRDYGIDAPAAILSRGNGQIDAFRFAHRLLQASMERGARIYDRTSVTDVGVHDAGVTIETDRGPRVTARRMVWASGYEALEETQRRFGRLYSTWAVVSEPVSDFGRWRDQVLIWETARPYLYARVTDDGRVMIGGEDEGWSRRHANDRLRARKAHRLIEHFKRLFPDIRLEIAYQWAGVFSTTKDGLPYIGTLPEHPGAWLALGYGGNGITFAMIAAHLILDAWLGTPNADAHIFAFDR